MNDRGDISVPDYAVDLMSEIHAKRLKQAEGTLLIADGAPKWILNVLTAVSGSQDAATKGFLAVIYTLLYESGFYFVDGPQNDSIYYDIRVMRQLDDSSALLKYSTKDGPKYTAEFSHKLMEPMVVKVVSYILPDSLKETIVVNFFLPDNKKVFTELFELRAYFNFYGLNFKNLELLRFRLKDLSLKVKNILHSILYIDNNDVFSPLHILSLPPHILQSLCKYLDGHSFVNFLRTCKYIHDNFFNDETIWKHYSLVEISAIRPYNETWHDYYKRCYNNKQVSWPKRAKRFSVTMML